MWCVTRVRMQAIQRKSKEIGGTERQLQMDPDRTDDRDDETTTTIIMMTASPLSTLSCVCLIEER